MSRVRLGTCWAGDVVEVVEGGTSLGFLEADISSVTGRSVVLVCIEGSEGAFCWSILVTFKDLTYTHSDV